MLVSIIVPAYNAERTLAQCITALRQQDYPEREIIVVDDGSTDKTGFIASSFGDVAYIRQENAGPAAARNRGAAAAHGEWLAFTDSDCIAEPDWITRLMEQTLPGVVGIGGTYGIANPESLLARIIHAEIRARHERQPPEVDFLGSFNVAYERKAFEAVGGFDESFSQASGEDNDLAYRMIDAGGKLRFTEDAVVKHHHPTRLLPYFKTQMRHGFWRVKLYQKHPNRRSGDAYANKAELRAPVIALITLAALPLLCLLSFFVNPLVAILAGIIGGTVISKLRPNYSKVLQRSSFADGVSNFYPVLASWREYPRAIGLAWGVWHFLILRRTAA